jgi:ABC-type xylose transport system permease subunit
MLLQDYLLEDNVNVVQEKVLNSLINNVLLLVLLILVIFVEVVPEDLFTPQNLYVLLKELE